MLKHELSTIEEADRFVDELNDFEVITRDFNEWLLEVFKKNKIKSILLADYIFENPYTAFPDSVSLKNVKMVKDRVGSVGGEILRRFHYPLSFYILNL